MRLFDKSKLEKISAQLSTPRRVVIVSHHNPDGDAVGSSLAMYHYLCNEGHDVKVILPNPFPHFLEWMPGSQDIVIAEKHLRTAKRLFKEAEVLFVMDMNAPHRSGKQLEPFISESTSFKVLIDHHLKPDDCWDVQISAPQASSTCELAYQVIEKLSGKADKITKEIAQCVYVGLITDTGSLSYTCNAPKTYQILARIMKKGVDGEQIHRFIFDSYSESRIKLLGLALGSRLQLLPNLHTSYMYLTRKDFEENNYKKGDTEGFVNYGLSIEGISVTAFFTERDMDGKRKIRISFRSKGDYDVSTLARDYFNGGGHRNASAAYFDGTMEEAIAAFTSSMQEFMKRYSSKK